MNKTLIYDIEASNLKGDFGFVLCIGYKWLGDKRVSVIAITDSPTFKTDPTNDKWVIQQFAKVLNQAEVCVAHYGCVAPYHKILMADFSYKLAKDIKVGDEVIGIKAPRGPNHKRQELTKTKVTYSSPVQQPMIRLTLSDGSTIDCSIGHPFWVPTGKANKANWAWKKATELKVGDILTRVCSTWDTKKSYEAGYIAAAVDGEGYISSAHGYRIGFAQKPNIMLEVFKTLTARDGFFFSHYVKEEVVHRLLLTGLSKVLTFLGTYQPKRLIENFWKTVKRLNIPTDNRTTIVKIESLGMGTVMGLSTENQTYIAEGLISHNSRFDAPFLQTRALLNKLPLLADVPVDDTWRIAKYKLALHSNRLAALISAFGTPTSKTPLTGPIWMKAQAGHRPSIQYVINHCKADVQALEEVYMKIKPLGLCLKTYEEKYGSVCPSCQSKDILHNGFRATEKNRYERLQCRACGKWWKGNIIKFKKAKS